MEGSSRAIIGGIFPKFSGKLVEKPHVFCESMVAVGGQTRTCHVPDTRQNNACVYICDFK